MKETCERTAATEAVGRMRLPRSTGGRVQKLQTDVGRRRRRRRRRRRGPGPYKSRCNGASASALATAVG